MAPYTAAAFLQEAGGRCFSPAGKPILAEITLDELRAKLR